MQSTEAVSDSKHQQQNDYDTIGAQLARPPARETEPPLTHQARTWQSLSKRVVFLVLFSMAFLHAAYTSFAYTDPADASRCQMAWMSPSYLRMDGLDERHSRLARKYSLWLYREQGWDLSNKPHGIPVLFAPGNAGSYRQVRSLAAAASRAYYDQPGQPRQAYFGGGHRELDFFAADFNEDFSAFHAATLREQAEYLSDALRYILTLYRDDDAGAPHPTSVIVVAHSMGGIAARLMLLQPDLPPGSVRTLVTLSTPHQIPPATFDREIERVYNDINRHWKESYASAPSEHPLKDLLLVSIAGGTADTTVSSDYTGISSFTPPSNGFTIFATSVPSLFSPVDHLAMVWCDQLRYSIVRGLLETTDAKAADRARPLPERLDIMQRALVAGLSTAERRATNGEGPVNLPIDTAQDVEGESMSWFSERGSTTEALFAFTPDPAQARVLEILTDISTASISVYSCIKSEVDFSCTSAKGRTVRQLPKSTSDSDPNTVRPLNEDYSSLIRVHEITAGRQLVIKVSDAKPGAFLAAAAKASFETTQMDTSVLALALSGTTLHTRTNAISTSFHFPRLRSSLLVYRIRTSDSTCSSTLAPLLIASTGDASESKYFPNFREGSVHLHSSPPFAPLVSTHEGMNLEILHDPQCSYTFHLSLDRTATLGKIILRYRSLVAAWPSMFAFLLLAKQSQHQGEGGAPVMASVLDILHRDVWYLLTATSSAGLGQWAWLNWVDPGSNTAASLLLGNHDLYLLYLIPCLILVAATVALALHVVLYSLVGAIARCWMACARTSPLVSSIRKPSFGKPKDGYTRRSLVTFASLVVLVLLFAPHQFAFLVLFLVHFDTTVRSWAETATAKDTAAARIRFERNYGVLFAMLCILPHNGVILLVWLRNLQAGWWAPFASDHNVFSIVGSLHMVEYLQSGRTVTVPAPLMRAKRLLLYMLVASLALFGPRYAYVAAIDVNVYFIVLYVLQVVPKVL